MSEIRNVILDWSGTLVDDFNPVLEATNEIFRHYGKPTFTAGEFREKFYLPFPEFYKEYLPESALPELDHHYHTAFKLLQTGIAPLPHALDFLEYLSGREMPTFLLSTIHHEHYEAQGGRLGVKNISSRPTCRRSTSGRSSSISSPSTSSTPRKRSSSATWSTTLRRRATPECSAAPSLTGYDSLPKLKSANPDLLFRNLREVRDFLDRHRGVATHPPVPTVGALIFNEQGEVLMIQTHKWSHKWGIPGGKIKLNEHSEEALRREVLEETGLKLAGIRFELVQDCIEPPEFYKKAHFLLLNYTATALGTSVVLNDEAENHRWVTPGEAMKLDLNGPTRILLDYVRSHPRG